MNGNTTAQNAPTPNIVCGDAMGQSMKWFQGINDFKSNPALSGSIGTGSLNQALISEAGRGGVSIGGANIGKTMETGADVVFKAPEGKMASAGIGESHDQMVLGS